MTKEEFRLLTPSEKRIVIAKDVIKQIVVDKFIARSGTYLSTTIADINEIKDVQEILKEAPHCTVCALGAIFASYVLINDQCPVTRKDWFSGYNNKFYFDGRTSEDFINILINLFGEQIDLIEAAFEGEGCFATLRLHPDKVERHDIDRAIAMFGEYSDGADRLVAIMQNIIDNNGEFNIND